MASECKKADAQALMQTPGLKDLQGCFRDCGATSTPDANHQKTVRCVMYFSMCDVLVFMCVEIRLYFRLSNNSCTFFLF